MFSIINGMGESVLKRLGFQKNWIYEVIVTTQSASGTQYPAHSAPVGVWTPDLKSVKFKLYPSKTLRNLAGNPVLTVSFPSGVQAFQDASKSKKLKYARTKFGYSLAGLSFIELKITGARKTGEAVEFTASVTGSRLKKDTRLFNRAEYMTLEYLIKKTKPNAAEKELEEYRRVISKVAPESIYTKIVGR